MALTYTSQRNLYGTLTNNSTTANLTLGDTLINQYTLQLIHSFNNIFTETELTLQTYPAQQFYNLPKRMRKINTLQINVGGSGSINSTGTGFSWSPTECPTRKFWNQLNLVKNISSDIPHYYFFYNNQVGIYPKPAAGYNPIHITGQIEVQPISTADYTTGTITTIPYGITWTGALAVDAVSGTLNAVFPFATGTYEIEMSTGEKILATCTNGSTAVTWTQPLDTATTTSATLRTALGGDIVTGSGTTWTTAKNGFSFQVAEPTGDNFWYTVDEVLDATHLSLTSQYSGIAISGGSATYILGESSLIPPAYQYIPVYRAVETYYTTISLDTVRSGKYKALADELESAMRNDYGNKDTDPTCADTDQPIINPNLTVNVTGSSTLQ